MKRKYRNPSKIQPRSKHILPEQVVSQHKYYASVQQQAYVNAIKAGGIRATIYNPLSHGIICSCDLRQEIVSEPEEDETNVHIEHNFHKSERTRFAPQNLDLSDLGIDDDFEHHALDEGDDEDRIMLDTETIDLSGYNQNKCNICYGTGFVGGYSIPKGFRHVLDTQHSNIEFGNAEVVTTTNPYQFELGRNPAWVEFKDVFIPKMDGTLVVRIWNNLEEIIHEDGLNKPLENNAREFKIQVLPSNYRSNVDGGDSRRKSLYDTSSNRYYLYREGHYNDGIYYNDNPPENNNDGYNKLELIFGGYSLINSNEHRGNHFDIRVAAGAEEGTFPFTHVELQIVKEKSFIDIAQFSEEDEPLLMANLLSTTINFLPDSGIQKFSVVNENKYNRAWQIKSVTPHKNHDNVIVSYECDARRIEPHEIYSNLLG